MIEVDIVIGVFDLGVLVVIGYFEVSGIFYLVVFLKNKYVGRIFIVFV